MQNSYNHPTVHVKLIILATILLLAMSGQAMVFAGSYSGGSGTSSAPYQISNLADLQELSQTSGDWGAYFQQTADIDAADTSTWNGGNGFDPIGDSDNNFTGSFNGNGHTITGLTINRDADNQGLFAKLGQGAVVKDLTINDVDMKTASKAGAVAGEAVGAEITNCTVENGEFDIFDPGPEGRGESFIGGLIGKSENTTIENCKASNLELMKKSSFPKSIWAVSGQVGGLAGLADGGEIVDSTVTDTEIISVDEPDLNKRHGIGYMGGLVGELANDYDRTMVVANCNVEDITLAVGISNTFTPSGESILSKSGGFVGAIADPGSDTPTTGDFVIKNNSITGTINKGAANKWGAVLQIGGFVGTVYGNETASGTIPIRNCKADVKMGRMQFNQKYLQDALLAAGESGGIGGFAGLMGSVSVEDSAAKVDLYSTLHPEGYKAIWKGGFAGTIRNSTFSTSYATGSNRSGYDLSGAGTGGFAVRTKNTEITESYAAVDVKDRTGKTYPVKAGFVGKVIGGSIRDSYSTGDIDGQGPAGFVNTAENDAEIKHTYTTGDVNNNKKYPPVAGLVLSAEVQDSIAFNSEINNQIYDLETTERVGPVLSGETVNSYANQEMKVVAGGTEVTKDPDLNVPWGADMSGEEFKTESFYTNPDNWQETWDFSDVWEVKPGDDRPTLQNIPGDSKIDIRGHGTKEEPYEIENWNHLDDVRGDLDSHYVLVNDLDESTEGYDGVASGSAKGGKGFDPIGESGDEFRGAFNGSGYTINGLTINRPTEDCIGPFGANGAGAEITNVGLEGVDITGNSFVGGIVGCSDGIVEQSYATGQVSGEASAVGGLVGRNQADGTVKDSYATSTVDGSGNVGGLVGTNEGEVDRSYATGTVDGGSNVGGLVGNNDSGTVVGSYWDTETSGRAEPGAGTGKPTSEMKDIFTFQHSDWNVRKVEAEENDYPYLAWEEDEGGVWLQKQASKELTVRLGPNPVNPEKEQVYLYYQFSPEVSSGTLNLYNAAGRQVYSASLSAGTSPHEWSLVNDRGEPLANGIYLYIVQAGDKTTDVGKLMVERK